MPGFVSYSQYASPDGEGVAVVEFESHETAAAFASRARESPPTCFLPYFRNAKPAG